MSVSEEYLKNLIRPVNDWPKSGVVFQDITPLLLEPVAMVHVTKALANLFPTSQITHIGALEARGFIFGAQLAAYLQLPLVPFRKSGKLPSTCLKESYELEYGTASIEVHDDALSTGDRILLVDDVIATGGTLLAANKLCKRLNAEVVGAAVIIDLPFLGGSERLMKHNVEVISLTHYES